MSNQSQQQIKCDICEGEQISSKCFSIGKFYFCSYPCMTIKRDIIRSNEEKIRKAEEDKEKKNSTRIYNVGGGYC